MAEKLDLKKTFKEFYTPPADRVVQVELPELSYLAVEGKGNPNDSEAFQRAIEAMYSVAYTMKFAFKKKGGPEYGVMPLEALWWTDEETGLFDPRSKDVWRWRLLILQPDFVTEADVAETIEQVKQKKDNPMLDSVRLERLTEGRSAQTMHVGPYSEEKPTIERVHAFIADQGGRPCGRHHEIYLGDPRRSAPEKLRTVIRQPMG